MQPTDLVKQSIPFSYLALTATPNDGASHSVQVYTDISAEWVTGDNTLIANWSITVGSVVTHQIQLAEQTVFEEIGDHIQRTRFLVFSTLILTPSLLEGAAYYSISKVCSDLLSLISCSIFSTERQHDVPNRRGHHRPCRVHQ